MQQAPDDEERDKLGPLPGDGVGGVGVAGKDGEAGGAGAKGGKGGKGGKNTGDTGARGSADAEIAAQPIVAGVRSRSQSVVREDDAAPGDKRKRGK